MPLSVVLAVVPMRGDLGRSPLGARGCRGRSHKRPLPPKAYFKIDQGVRGIPPHIGWRSGIRLYGGAEGAGLEA